MTENKGKNKTRGPFPKEADSRAASLNTCQGWTTLKIVAFATYMVKFK